MNCLWVLDKKNQAQQSHTRDLKSKPKLFNYIKQQQQKRNEITPEKIQLLIQQAQEHSKRLTQRHHIHEKRDIEARIIVLRGALQSMNDGTWQQQFLDVVQPYLDYCNKIEQKKVCKISSTSIHNPRLYAEEIHKQDEGKLQDELAMILENKAPEIISVSEDQCSTCNIAMIIMASEARLGCPLCGRTQLFLQTTSARIPYGEEVEFGSFSYKRQNHFQEWLNSIQAKENTEVPNTVIQDVMQHLYYKNNFRKPVEIKPCHIRLALKQFAFRKHYDHVMQIYVSITGRQPPRFTSFQEEQLRLMFAAIQAPFKKHCPADRKNFLSYSYCLFKFCELLGYDHFLQYFMLLKGPQKLQKQDYIFKRICGELDWQFIASNHFALND